MDCSGLVQYAWREAGINLPRTSQAQMNFGAAVPRADIQPGDLVFPSSAAGGHVQMYAGNGKVIEAPYSGATVRITQMPSQVMAIRRPL
ncbi:C40 family peptidase [Mycobacterium kubicae]|uniref:C40 family peptidase n=1 Tax=Mycobacterium kubicae TaxID=120959 RepID=UPI001FD5CF1A|nr:C40 family peptidase [Mycobacterium kubicae]